jgi:hypothetical protein
LLLHDAWEGEETSHYWRICQKLRRATICFLRVVPGTLGSPGGVARYQVH